MHSTMKVQPRNRMNHERAENSSNKQTASSATVLFKVQFTHRDISVYSGGKGQLNSFSTRPKREIWCLPLTLIYNSAS